MSSTADLFEPLSSALPECGVAHGPSELHGLICGLEGSSGGTNGERLLEMLAEHVDRDGPWPEPVRAWLLRLQELAREGLAGEDMDLELLLPPDGEELGLRVAALAQWCEGFLAGFGAGSAGLSDSDLTAELQEAISDLSQISQVETPSKAGDEEERMLEEVTEHCRVAALLVFTEMQALREPQQPQPETPLH